jgi:hypothetical protein
MLPAAAGPFGAGEWADANSELFKEAHDEAVHKNSYKRKLYELISASLDCTQKGFPIVG